MLKQRILAVSYTHLDVYKRQKLNTFLLLKHNSAGKLPLSLIRFSPKTKGREYSTNQDCMQKMI